MSPTMFEIYDNYSSRYDELVNHEDYKLNLNKKLKEIVDFNGKTVIEPGMGTGRVTRIYAEDAARIYGLDASGHMLNQAGRNLASFADKISYRCLDNMLIRELGIKADIIIEGWAFGHSVIGNKERITEFIPKLINGCEKSISPGGKIVIIETMGTGVLSPAVPDKSLENFYRTLEDDFHFTREVISTDYRFESVEKAAEVCGFFFGADMRNMILNEQISIIPEFTGIWHKSYQFAKQTIPSSLYQLSRFNMKGGLRS